MEYVQERVATFHDYGGARPAAPTDRATVVVPLAERDHTSPATERVLHTLEVVDPERVLVPLRASASAVATVTEWLESFDLDLTVLWCTAPAVERLLGDAGLNGVAGKGRDVWLGLGEASRSQYVAVHDADAITYDRWDVPKLLYPLSAGYEFSKGYYARVEDERFYGRLFRLFYTPLVQALGAESADPFVSYLDSFRYALAGEFAMTGDLAREMRAPRDWGLELGTLGEAFEYGGFADTAQVDLGIHEHEHRSVEGAGGLGEMCAEVAATLFTTVEERGVAPDYASLRERFRDHADRLVEQYAGDAGFNGFEFDADREREQVRQYADAITPPGEDGRLPAWRDAPIEPEQVMRRSSEAIEERR